MTFMRRVWIHPLSPLVFFCIGLTGIEASSAMNGRVMPFECAAFARFMEGMLILLWVQLDARRRRIVPCFEFAWLLAPWMPASLIWYCVWSRRLKGIPVFVGLMVLIAVPQLVWDLLIQRL